MKQIPATQEQPIVAASRERAALFQSTNFSRNLRQAAATSSWFRMAETTQMRRAPAASTSSRLAIVIPPIANQGMSRLAAAQRTYSKVTGLALGFVPVANTGPIAM